MVEVPEFDVVAQKVKLPEAERKRVINGDFGIKDIDILQVFGGGAHKYPVNVHQLMYWKIYGHEKYYKLVDELNKHGFRRDIPKYKEPAQQPPKDEAKHEIDSDELSFNGFN